MTAAPRCEWAGCDRDAVVQMDGWWHCAPDLALHKELTYGGRLEVDLDTRAEQIRPLMDAGMNDRQIAEHLGITAHTVKRTRAKAGLVRVGGGGSKPKPIEHGTSSGYKAHYRRGEKPCQACRMAQGRWDADNYQRRKAKRQDGAA